MAIAELVELSGIEKASVLLMALGTSASAQVFKHLSDEEIEKLSGEIVRMRTADPQLMKLVVSEFERTWASGIKKEMEGRDFAAQVLEKAVGREKADEMLRRAGSGNKRPFSALREAEPSRIARVIAEEPAQIIALVLANLQPDKAAAVLSLLDEETQTEAALQICSIGEIDAEVVNAIDFTLQTRLASLSSQSQFSCGPQALVEILNKAGRSTGRAVLDSLKSHDPSIGEQVRSMMFVFEDMPTLGDRAIQCLLREIAVDDLCVALKGCDDEIRELFFRNMSQRAAENLKEDLESAAPVKVRDIELAQQCIEGVVRRLMAEGHITPGNSREDMVL